MQTLENIRHAVLERPEELARLREKGEKVVGYFCCYIPEEIILALGLIPVRLGRGGDEALLNLGSTYISDNNCAFTRESIGLFAEGKDSFVINSDIVAAAGTCIQMYRLSELIRYYFQPKTISLGVPRNFYFPEGREYFRAEMQSFARKLEELCGKKLREDLLKESIKLCQAIRDAISQIYDYQALNGASLSYGELLDIIQAGFYIDRRCYLRLLEELLAEIKDRERTVEPDSRPRLMLSGSIIAPGDTKIIGIIEEVGGKIVADDLCTGLRFSRALVVKEASLEAIADAYLDRIPCASLPCLLPIEEDRRFINMVKMIQDYKVEGMIYHTLRFCDPHTLKANTTKRFLQEKLNLPFLELHTEYSPLDVEVIKSRLESFIELFRANRKEEVSIC